MNWRFGDHRRFQWDALAIAGAGGGIGVVAWAWQLGGAAWWVATGRRAAAGGVGGTLGSPDAAGAAWRWWRWRPSPARRWPGATWQAFASPVVTLALVEAALVGMLAGLAASLGLALVHVERVPAAPLARRWPTPACADGRRAGAG